MALWPYYGSEYSAKKKPQKTEFFLEDSPFYKRKLK